jgi:hypothetical protein
MLILGDAGGGEPLFLTFLDVLDDEDRALAGTEDSPLDPLRVAYTEARRSDAGRDHTETERAFRTALFARLHSRKRAALCFSGGGIRSATFGLGVLQGLAMFSRADEGCRPKLLGEFDYLSTVSGGGYLGSWFSAWATRLSREGKVRLTDGDVQDSTDGPAEVIARLAKSPDSTFEPEPQPVRHLREYTNYLVPRSGLFSGDTWALVAVVIRNILLNWLVLLPILNAVILAPALAEQLTRLAPDDVTPATLWFFLGTGVALGGVATAYIGYNLPNAGNGRLGPKGFMAGSLAPLSLAAIQLNVFWALLPIGSVFGRWWDVAARGKSGLTFLHFGLLGAAMHGFGMFLGLLLATVRFNRPPRQIGVIATLAAALTGFVGGVVGNAAGHLSTYSLTTGAMLKPKLYVALAFPMLMGVFFVTGTLLVGLTSYITEDEDREWWARAGGLYLLIAVSWFAFAIVVLYAAETLTFLDIKLKAAALALTSATGWSVARLGASSGTAAGRRESAKQMSDAKQSSPIKEIAAKLILPVFLGLLVMSLATANRFFLNLIDCMPVLVPSLWPHVLAPMGNATAHGLWLIGLYLVVCLTASWFINVNKFSLHGMYRQRLIRTYLGASNAQREPNRFTGFDQNDNISMYALTRYKPLHIVNIALNLVHGSDLAWQQRKAASFTSSRLHTGSCRVGYSTSKFYGGRYKDHPKKTPISLGTAVTISGAAASPNMGYHSSPLLTLVMTLFNARLGWWLGNPKAPASVWKLPGPWLGVIPFLDELLGLTDDKNNWIYLSDGGHFENLGIYEMVLRRCSLIVVSDAGADPRYTYADLANAVRKVRIDMGIPIEFDQPRLPMSPTRQPDAKFSGNHCATGRIHYEAVDPDAEPGIIIYIKASMNGNEPPDVKNYAALDPTFPHQSTADQFFDESQFESYRRLGLHVIEEICGVARHGGETFDLTEFQQRVANYAAQPVA